MIELDEARARDIRERHDALQAWLKANRRNSYRAEEARAAGLNPPTNLELSALEIFEFKRDKPDSYFAYVETPSDFKSLVPGQFTSQVGRYRHLHGRPGQLITFMGQRLGTVQFGLAFRDNFGGTRIPINVTAITGETYHGTYFASSGDYARLKKDKHQR